MKHLIYSMLLLAIPCHADTTSMLRAVIAKGGEDIEAPTLDSATINGTTLTLNFSENVTRGAGYADADIDVDMSTTGSNIAVTYASGDGGLTLVYTTASPAVAGETIDLDFNGDANSLEDDAGNDLLAIISGPVTNLSETNPGTTNLVAWWDLTESAGTITTIADDNTTANDLTTTGSPGGGTTAKFGTTINWNGSNQYANSADADFDVTGALSFGAWVYHDNTSDERFMAKYTASGNQRGYLLNTATNKAQVNISSNGTALTSATSTSNVGTGTWVFIVAVFVPSTSLTIYYNGTAEHANTSSIPASIFNTSADFMLGTSDAGGTASNHWDGMIQSAFVYSKALTAGEVSWLYNSGTGRQFSSL